MTAGGAAGQEERESPVRVPSEMPIECEREET